MNKSNVTIKTKTIKSEGIVFTGQKIAEKINRSKRTVKLWTDEGIIIPDIKVSRGRGKTRIFSERNLIEFAMADVLLEIGVSLAVIKEILEKVKRHKNFYKNPDWGSKNDLIYVGDPKNPQSSTIKNVKCSNYDSFIKNYLTNSKKPMFTFIFIGKIRNMALKKLGMPS